MSKTVEITPKLLFDISCEAALKAVLRITEATAESNNESANTLKLVLICSLFTKGLCSAIFGEDTKLSDRSKKVTLSFDKFMEHTAKVIGENSGQPTDSLARLSFTLTCTIFLIYIAEKLFPEVNEDNRFNIMH